MATFLETLTVPAETGLSSPARRALITVPGELLLLRLYVPPGPRGEVYLRLKHAGVQLAPARAGTWWRPDDAIIDFPLEFSIGSGDVIFYLEGASPTANFDHSIDFELLVNPEDSTVTATASESLASRVLGLLRA